MAAARLLLAPAGHGKTAHVVAAIRSLPPLSPVRVLVPDQVEAAAFRRRLAQAGGALGVEVQTFYGLYADVLALAAPAADPPHAQPNGGMARLSPAVRHRLIQYIAEGLAAAGEVPYYAPVCSAPGFVRLLGELFGELKRARVLPHALEAALAGREPRLHELARLYAAYQAWLLDTGWVDADGQGWLAAIALETHPALLSDLALLAVDGFDEFNPTQMHLLRLLAGRARQTIVTLTGDPRRPDRLAHRRFARARVAVAAALGVPDPLADPDRTAPPGEETLSPLACLERRLFEPAPDPGLAGDALAGGPDGAVTFLEAQNRAAEAREALRWLKACLVRDGLPFSQVAVVARDSAAYRPFLEEVAAEFGVPLRFASGADLAANPAIAALLDLLVLPLASEGSPGQGPDAWTPRALLDALTSSYLDWSDCGLPPAETRGAAIPGAGGAGAYAALPGRLYDVACAGQVLGGLEQWREAFRLMAERSRHEPASLEAALQDDEAIAVARPPAGPEVDALRRLFEAIVARLTPPAHAPLRAHVAWIEALIGGDPTQDRAGADDGDEADALHLVARAAGGPATMERDLAALRAFKDILRGLVLADDVLSTARGAALPYGRFVADLIEAVAGATYTVPVEGEAVLVASALEVRGLSFDAVALLGLAEGDFPRAEREDVLLRDTDRAWLAHPPHGPGFAIEPSLRGDEASIFYQAVTRARRRLLLSRPYLADDGQPWEASPYWSAVRRLFSDAPLRHVRPADPLADPASAPELAATTAGAGLNLPAAVQRARAGAAPSSWNGDLTALRGELGARFGADQAWSCSRLETYAQCPHYFWAAYAMELAPRAEPQAGFDALILGSIYHRILEQLYRRVADGDPERLRAELPDVARQVFDAAPADYGFRPTALWAYQRQELTEVLRRTLEGLIAASEGYAPRTHELPFGLHDRPPLVLEGAVGTVRLRGYIDRVDAAPDGRLRIIDYKSGSTAITVRDLTDGRRLQLPLYALAAAQALGAEVAGGFYWHINAAQPSQLDLERFAGGVDAAIETAVEHALAISAAVRDGRFAPRSPGGGCPAACPAIVFCERYVGRGW